jgi:hypothetical protein
MANLTTEEKKQMGFPFEGFPTKNNKETWAEWESRCKTMGFDTSKIEYAVPMDGVVAMYRDKKVRELSDKMRDIKPEILKDIKPSNDIAPTDWSEGYREMYPKEYFPEIY